MSIDSALFKTEASFVIQLRSEQNQEHKAASQHKTCAPLFNKNTFEFNGATKQLRITALQNRGNSLQHYGECNQISLQTLSLQLDSPVTRSLAVLDFKQQSVGRMNVTFELTNDKKYAKDRLRTLVEQMN